jgi:hypothetical protein
MNCHFLMLTVTHNILGENVSSPSRDNGSQSGKFQSQVGPYFPSFLLFNYKFDDLQVTTPLLFKLIPAVINLGVLMHWFPSENGTQNEVSLSLSLSLSLSHICPCKLLLSYSA